MKLSIPEYQQSRNNSEKYILKLCKKLNIAISSRGILKESILVGDTQINLSKEVDYVRENGKALILQQIVDSQDRFLNSPFSMAIFGNDIGIGFKLNSNYGDHSTEVVFPGCIEAPEISFTDDIVYYRKEVVRAFNAEDYSAFSRAYRACLQSSISLVDCFIHRYTFHVKQLIPSTSEYSNTKVLDSHKSIEERLDAWIATFAAHKIDEYKTSKNRHMFFELKKQRNSIVHAASPTVGYGVRDVVRHLNNVQHGIGTFLSELRMYTEFTEDIGFIRQIKTLPDIKILKK